MEKILPIIIKSLIFDEKKLLLTEFQSIASLLARYCDFKSVFDIVKAKLKMESDFRAKWLTFMIYYVESYFKFIPPGQ